MALSNHVPLQEFSFNFANRIADHHLIEELVNTVLEQIASAKKEAGGW